MSIKTIYSQLVSAGLSPAGACGLMGNFQAESAMRSNNAQDGMTRMSDDEYTAAVDNDTYGRFVVDSVGYGLCQWTYHTRKAALLAYAKNNGTSIGDEQMQIAFCIKELKSDYPALWAFLCATNDTYSAASRVCTEFERPAVNNISVRANAAKMFFEQLNGLTVENTAASTIKETTSAEASTGGKIETVREVQIWLNQNYSAGLMPDGLYGTLTQRALTKALQKCLGVASDGIFGEVTYKACRRVALRQGSSGALVRVLQAFLVCNGYKAAYIDGYFGSGTESALIAFQKQKKLDADGVAGHNTFKALCS